MPKTESNQIPFGIQAPEFTLPNAAGSVVARSDFRDKPLLLVVFLSNRCPFVLHIRDQLAAFAKDYAALGLGVVAINSNDADAHPEESLQRVGKEEQFYGFTYLKDTTQEVAKQYGAACTPDFFLYDDKRRLAYHGQFDDARPGNGKPVTGRDLRAAVDAALKGQPVAAQTPSIGCNIKWTPGNEPASYSTAA